MLSHVLCVERFKKAGRFAEPTEAEIVALLEKATPEKKITTTKYGIKFLNGMLMKMKKYFQYL